MGVGGGRSPPPTPTPTLQDQALSAILFLYKEVLGKPIETGFQYVGAKRPKRLPVVLTKSEVQQILVRLSGDTKLVVQLLYGRGLRLNEAVRLRVKDIDFEQYQISFGMGKALKIEYRCCLKAL